MAANNSVKSFFVKDNNCVILLSTGNVETILIQGLTSLPSLSLAMTLLKRMKNYSMKYVVTCLYEEFYYDSCRLAEGG